MTPSPAPNCTACESPAARQDPFYYEWQGRHFWIYRCGRCTHQFAVPPITRQDQDSIYSERYFSKDGDWACGIFKAGYIEAEPQLRAEAREVLGMLPVRSGRLLDMGSAGGVFLDEARSWGFDVEGVELNPIMAEHARRAYHLRVLTARIEDVPDAQWPAAFDVVTLLDCLEHIPQPLKAMRKIRDWLRPGGLVLIRGPLANSPVAHFKEGLRRLLAIPKRLDGYPLDASAFNRRSLEVLLATSGFDIAARVGQTASFSNILARRKP